jgi:RTX calcium-binding nonapeptide repeat (4 copies)
MDSLAPRALAASILVLVTFPAASHATTASVEPFVESPSVDPFGSCSRYMQCPPDMVVVTAAPAENNHVIVALESSAPAGGGIRPRYRYIVSDNAGVQAGAGCEQLHFQAVACTAGTVGPVQLGDGDDWFASSFGSGDVHGGDGQDVLQHSFSRMTGGDGDDVLVGLQGAGGGGDDVLMVQSGAGDSGADVLTCFPRDHWCHLDGGSGDDLLTGGTGLDRLFGRSGADVLRGGADFDTLRGGPGGDRLAGGAGGDHLHGDAGADRLVSREDRSAGERLVLDRVDCGTSRRDRAVADRRDDVKRCERVAR